jgi:hypothetical protein
LPCAAHDFAAQTPLPHTFAMPPPPHVSPEGHVPHAITPPQPSSVTPQFFDRSWHVLGMHPASGPVADVPGVTQP